MQNLTTTTVSTFVIAPNDTQNDDINYKSFTYFDFIREVNSKISAAFNAQIEAGLRPVRPKAGVIYYTKLCDIRPNIVELLEKEPFNPIHAWNIDPRCNEFVERLWNAE